MGKKKRNAIQQSGETLELPPQQLKKQKTSHLPLAQIPPADNRPANENQKLVTPLPLEIAKKKQKKKKKTSASQQKPEATTPVEPVKKNKRPSKNKTNRETFKEQLKGVVYLKGRDLNKFLDRLSRVLEGACQKSKEYDKIWMKQLFSVGINEVTRTLERMPAATFEGTDNEENGHRKPFSRSKTGTYGRETHLQAVLAAIDCHPRLLVSHLAGLASSRGVPLFYVEDNGTGSMRLGQLLKLKTTTAIGVKVGGSAINSVIEDAIHNQLMARESWKMISD